jgi:hypothetical protein
MQQLRAGEYKIPRYRQYPAVSGNFIDPHITTELK